MRFVSYMAVFKLDIGYSAVLCIISKKQLFLLILNCFHEGRPVR